MLFVFQVNTEREDCREKLRFLHAVLAPFLESYLVTAHHINKLTDMETPGQNYRIISKNLLSYTCVTGYLF